MRGSAPEIDRFLDELARQARAGDRLPPIRELMKRFGASQVAVQRAFGALKEKGLIKSEVGRGTFFVGDGATAGQGRDPHAPLASAGSVPHEPSHGPSVLLLRRSISVARGRLLIEGLQKALVADGARVLELSYTDPLHARAVLKSLPRFDACVVQSTYRTIPIELLAELRDKCTVLAVDGLALAGADVESVGTEWGEPLDAAVASLRARGHHRIAFATTSHPFLSTQLAMRHFRRLARDAGPALECSEITLPLLPDEGFADALVEHLRALLQGHGSLPFSALVAWGVEDGAAFRAALARVGVDVPSQLSVVLLGRPDIASEHADFFDIVGSHVADQVEALRAALQARMRSPAAPYGAALMPVRSHAGHSVAAVPVGRAKRSQR